MGNSDSSNNTNKSNNQTNSQNETNETDNTNHDTKEQTEEDVQVEIPRYTIKCKANIKQKYFESLSIEKLLNSVMNERNEKVFGYDFEIYDKDKGFELVSYSFRGIKNHYIGALHACFMYHLPFQIRPDDIWIIIGQGIASHIVQNAEKLRKTFVGFDGKKEIIVRDDNLNINAKDNDWSFVLEQFGSECKKLTNNDIVDVITCNFNTTSIASKTASQCILFKALSEYISFSTMTMSGIPEITLIGCIEDWKKIKSKIDDISKMNIGLDFWLKYVDIIIDNIIETVLLLSDNKKLNEKLVYFWESIYMFQSNSGGDAVSGWIKTLFPYLISYDDKNGMMKNSELKWDYSDDEYGEWAHVSPGSFPASFSRCPMKWKYLNKTIKCSMYGGIFGIVQQKKTGCIAPVLGWTIAGKH